MAQQLSAEEFLKIQNQEFVAWVKDEYKDLVTQGVITFGDQKQSFDTQELADDQAIADYIDARESEVY